MSPLSPDSLCLADPPIRSDRLRVIVSYLQMNAPPHRRFLPPPQPGLVVARAYEPTLSFYRYLYHTVGEPWLWHERRLMSDETLTAIIRNPQVEVWVLYRRGTPAGFAEIDRRDAPWVYLAYFGLIPDFIGQKLGPWFLDWIVATAWASDTVLFGVNTCTFDHPKAYNLYCRAGFTPLRHVTRLVKDPRREGILPQNIAPHIPLADS
ncbi:GNAT family acetyltransferase [Azospirillaceae bacterium]